MAGYRDTRQLIIDTLTGRPAGTEIQPEDHQKFALALNDYIRSIELSSGSPLVGIAESDTVPIESNISRIAYIASVPQNTMQVFTHFKKENGEPITITTTDFSVFVTLLWNTQYWDYQILPISVSGDMTVIIPEFDGVITNAPTDLIEQSVMDTSGQIVFCVPLKHFIYRLGLNYYASWPTVNRYNIAEVTNENTIIWRVIPNKLFKDRNGAAYIYDELTSTFSKLRSLQVADTIGNSDNIPMSQKIVTNLYNEGYKFAQLVGPGDVLRWSAEKKVFYITSVSGEYRLPTLSESTGTVYYREINLVAGTMLVNGEYGMEPWFISPSYGLSVYGSPSFNLESGGSVGVVISELAEADLNTGMYSTQSFRSSEEIDFDGTPRALILTGQISNQTGEISVETWPPFISEPYIPLLISNGIRIIGGALFGAYTAWKLSPNGDNFLIVDSTGSATREVELNSCYTVEITEEASLTSLQLSIPVYLSGDCGFIKIAVVNRSTASAVLAPTILLGSGETPYKYDQSIVNLDVSPDKIALFEIYIVHTLIGERSGQALLDRKDYDI